jgi:uncharacterized protein (DUF433 family)
MHFSKRDPSVIGQIVCTPGYSSGSPRIADTRLTCENVVTALGYLSIDEYLANYDPMLELADVQACLKYCAEQRCLFDQPENYCERCSSDTREDLEPIAFSGPNGLEANEHAQGQSGHVYLGTRQEWENEQKPRAVWLEAKALLSRLEP